MEGELERCFRRLVRYWLTLQAVSIGRSSKTVREFLEKNYPEELSRADTIKLTIKSLLEVVQTGAKNIEISVMESYGKVTVSLSCPWNPHAEL